MLLHWIARRTPERPGAVSAAFLVFYAVIRIGIEYFRAPDSALVAGFTKGQFFSLFMLIGGLVLLLRLRRTAPQKSTDRITLNRRSR
jgi:phosphatidylglycerol:prolipoprotein diacylglycerol transferase